MQVPIRWVRCPGFNPAYWSSIIKLRGWTLPFRLRTFWAPRWWIMLFFNMIVRSEVRSNARCNTIVIMVTVNVLPTCTELFADLAFVLLHCNWKMLRIFGRFFFFSSIESRKHQFHRERKPKNSWHTLIFWPACECACPCVWAGVTCAVTDAQRPAVLSLSVCCQHPRSQRWEWTWRSAAVPTAPSAVWSLLYFDGFSSVSTAQLLCKHLISVHGKTLHIATFKMPVCLLVRPSVSGANVTVSLHLEHLCLRIGSHLHFGSFTVLHHINS